MMVSGASGILGNAVAGDPETIDYSKETRMPRTVGTANMTPNVMHFKKGGKIDDDKVAKVMREYNKGKLHSGSKKGPIVKNRKQAIAIALSEARNKALGGTINDDMIDQDLIQIEGPTHEEGGIQYGNVKVEGGETVYDNTVNSDSWKITEDIADEFGLPKEAVNKTAAEYSKVIDKRYEKRKNNPFDMKSKKIELKNLTYMSKVMGEVLGNKEGEAQNGTYLNPIKLPQVNVMDYGSFDRYNPIIPRLVDSMNPIGQRDGLFNDVFNYDSSVPEASLSSVTSMLNTDKLGKIGNTVMGIAPMAISAFQAARTAAEGPDKVKLPRIHYDPMNPELIDPAYQVQQAQDAFATGNEQISQVSKKDWLRRRIQSATEEGKATSGIRGATAATNTQLINQSRQYNKENQLRTDMTNLEATMQEENINAANKGAWQTARDYHLSSLGTMLGQRARDNKLDAANEKYNNTALDYIREILGNVGYTVDENGRPIRTSSTTGGNVSVPSIKIGSNANTDYMNDYEGLDFPDNFNMSWERESRKRFPSIYNNRSSSALRYFNSKRG
jgi:hypothetical protein